MYYPHIFRFANCFNIIVNIIMILKLNNLYVLGYNSKKITNGLIFFKTFNGFVGTCKYNELTKSYNGLLEMTTCDLDTEHSIKWQFEHLDEKTTYTLNYVPKFHKVEKDSKGNVTINKLYLRLERESKETSFMKEIINLKMKLT